MADASCSGPSPFKRLVDHQARDVSHHQDRLVEHSASHGHSSFRSHAQHSNPAQDGFGSFLGGNSALPGMPHDPAGRLQAHAAALRPANPSPFAAASFANQARQSPSGDVGNWAADFTRFSSQQRNTPIQGQSLATSSSMQMNQPPSQLNFQAAFGQPNAAFGSHFGFANGGYANADPSAIQRAPVAAEFDQEMSRWMASHGGGNMDHVDAAMDQMARELELNDAALAQAEAASQSATQEHAEVQSSHFTDLETPEIGNLSLESNNLHLQEQEQPLSTEDGDSADLKARSAVSEAAERLLESVQHEDGEKWQNSIFLSLMRDFRDGKKDIVDNEIRQTGEDGDAVQQAT